ncbi:type II secretion system protein GspL [Roseobacter sp. A03A-229]
MFTQCGTGCRPDRGAGDEAGQNALVACAQPAFSPAACDALAARLTDAARAAKQPDPIVIAGASVTLFAVPLPLKTRRQRVSALDYALDGQLCTTSPADHLTLGPQIGPDQYLVAVCDDAALAVALDGIDRPGIAIPDVLGVPRPRTADPTWHLWRDGGAIYVRSSDGTGFVCRGEELASFWAVAGKPKLTSLTGPIAGGPPVVDISQNPPAVDPTDLQLDLRHGAFRHRKRLPRRFVRSAIAATVVAAMGHLALLAADARALARIADDHIAGVDAQLATRMPSLTADQPLSLIEARFARSSTPKEQDPFMTLFSYVSEALTAQAAQITFRELRYGARDGVMTLLIQGRDFGPLQRAEAALIEAGLRVTSGTAHTTEAGAEVLLQVRRGQ